jgi:hypothetical protein
VEASAESSSAAGGNALPTISGPPEPLEAGTYVTPAGFDPAITVTVPDGWYGGALSSGFTVGQGLDEVNERYAGGGIYVEVISAPFDEAVRAFENLAGLVQEGEPERAEIDGRSATTFFVHAEGDPVLFGEIAPGLDVIADTGQVTFIDVQGTTLLVRTEVFDEGVQPALEEVISSLTFP